MVEKVKIEKIANKITDGDWIESCDQSDSGIRLIQTGNIGNGKFLDKNSRARYISLSTFEKLKCTEVFPNDILISRLPDPVGRSCILPSNLEKSITAVDCTILRIDTKICIEKFFVYYTQSKSYSNQIQKYLSGTTRKRISRKNLENIEIPLPSVQEQQHIVKVLDIISKIIDKRKQQIAKLDELEKSLFIEMFGDPVTNPMGWEKRKLSEFTTVETGATPSRTNPEYYVKNGVPWVKTGEVNNTEIDVTSESISRKAIDNSNCKVFPVNTILLAMYGQGVTRGKVGLLKIEATTNQACAAILPNISYNSIYLMECMKHHYNTIRDFSRGGNQKNLNLSIVKDYFVIFPPIKAQNVFSTKFTEIEKNKKKLKICLEKMQESYNALMQQYFG